MSDDIVNAWARHSQFIKSCCVPGSMGTATDYCMCRRPHSQEQRQSASKLVLINCIDMSLIGARVAARELMGKQDVMLSFPEVP